MKRGVWRYVICILILLGVAGCSHIELFSGKAVSESSRVDAMTGFNYRTEMILLIEQISNYARAQNKSFQVIGNNGLDLFRPEIVGEAYVQRLVSSVGGIIMEGFHYGWEMKDDRRTPARIRDNLNQSLTVPLQKNLPVLNIDYCALRRNVDRSYTYNEDSGFIAFAADKRQLDGIPKYPVHIHRENFNNVKKLQQAQNFLVLFNSQAFPDKQSYLEALKDTNYDLVIIDLYYEGESLTASEVDLLRIKKNGASRLVFAYMSVGEAEDYRDYWQNSWTEKRPNWLAEPNPDWVGNFKVKYWHQEWKNILFGSPDSYLDKILAAGFDGAFLDVIDAYEYFEDKE